MVNRMVKGARAERRTVSILKADGYTCTRASGSVRTLRCHRRARQRDPVHSSEGRVLGSQAVGASRHRRPGIAGRRLERVLAISGPTSRTADRSAGHQSAQRPAAHRVDQAVRPRRVQPQHCRTQEAVPLCQAEVLFACVCVCEAQAIAAARSRCAEAQGCAARGLQAGLSGWLECARLPPTASPASIRDRRPDLKGSGLL